jgi:hypothetical protein
VLPNGPMAPPPRAASRRALLRSEKPSAKELDELFSESGRPAAAARETFMRLLSDAGMCDDGAAAAGAAGAWVKGAAFYHLRQPIAMILSQNATQHLAWVNKRLINSFDAVITGELLAAGALQMAAPARRRLSAAVAAALLAGGADSFWDDACWQPGGGVVPRFNRGPTAAELEALAQLRRFAQRLWLWLARPDPHCLPADQPGPPGAPPDGAPPPQRAAPRPRGRRAAPAPLLLDWLHTGYAPRGREVAESDDNSMKVGGMLRGAGTVGGHGRRYQTPRSRALHDSPHPIAPPVLLALHRAPDRRRWTRGRTRCASTRTTRPSRRTKEACAWWVGLLGGSVGVRTSNHGTSLAVRTRCPTHHALLSPSHQARAKASGGGPGGNGDPGGGDHQVGAKGAGQDCGHAELGAQPDPTQPNAVSPNTAPPPPPPQPCRRPSRRGCASRRSSWCCPTSCAMPTRNGCGSGSRASTRRACARPTGCKPAGGRSRSCWS